MSKRKPPKSLYWDMYRQCWKKARAEGMGNVELLLRVAKCLEEQARVRKQLAEEMGKTE